MLFRSRTLLEAGADVDTADEDGQTPMHQASQNGHMEAFNLLLAAGASTETRDKKGKSPVDCAKNVEEVIKAIQTSVPNDILWISKTHEYLSELILSSYSFLVKDKINSILEGSKEKLYWNI